MILCDGIEGFWNVAEKALRTALDVFKRSQEMTVAIEVGSSNVYADLGYSNAAEMQRKSSLAAEIARAIEARLLTQEAAADLGGLD